MIVTLKLNMNMHLGNALREYMLEFKCNEDGLWLRRFGPLQVL
jgi:hypothetical protein